MSGEGPRQALPQRAGDGRRLAALSRWPACAGPPHAELGGSLAMGATEPELDCHDREPGGIASDQRPGCDRALGVGTARRESNPRKAVRVENLGGTST